MNWKTCSEKELWLFVASHLKKYEIDTTLVGGAVVSIYSEGAYKSGDLDIVLDDYFLDKSKLAKAMKDLSFEKKGRHWVHPECDHLFIEFVLPPVSIGNDYRITPRIVKHKKQNLHIFTPEDCVKDRLASYIYFNARECFDQALMVCKANKIDFAKIKEWCDAEGGAAIQAFDELISHFKK